MLIFVSDLHLMDEGFKEAIPTSRLVQVVDGTIRRALERGVKEHDVQFVLLGDIFEIIKSQQWIDNDVRPCISSAWRRSSLRRTRLPAPTPW